MKKTGVMMLALLLCMLSACKFSVSDDAGKEDAAKPQEVAQEASDDGEQLESAKPQRPGAGEKPAAQVQGPETALVGDWIVVAYTSYSGKPTDSVQAMESSFYMAEDDYMESTLNIYEDSGALYADYSTFQYESNRTGYHLPVEIVHEPLYEECENHDWYAKIVNPRNKEELMKITLTGENELIDYDLYIAEDVEDPWKSITINTYLRDGSEELKNKDDLKYEKVVTVSNVQELLDEIDKSTRIILEGGVYNFNDLPDSAHSGKYADLNRSMDGDKLVTIRDLSYLCLEAKEGANVEICVESPYDPVLGFSYCNDVTIKGITFGHHVEPGTCGGSVLSVNGSSSFVIDDCRLYGCGAYGLDTYDSGNIRMNNTEIYECTYGIMSLSNTYGVTCENCNMHDNQEYDMIWASGSGNVSFENCTFTNNLARSEYNNDFLKIQDDCYSFAFRNCTFKDNSYRQFCASDVEIENCSFKDKIMKE